MSTDEGGAAVEFVAVVPLLFAAGLAVLQLVLVAHVQAVVNAAASAGARAAAVSLSPEAAARARAERLVGSALGDVPMTGFALIEEQRGGLPVVTVQVSARPDMPLLPDLVTLTGTGRALVEGPA